MVLWDVCVCTVCCKLLIFEWPIFKIAAKKNTFYSCKNMKMNIENGVFFESTATVCVIKLQLGSTKVFQLQIAASKNFLSCKIIHENDES